MTLREPRLFSYALSKATALFTLSERKHCSWQEKLFTLNTSSEKRQRVAHKAQAIKKANSYLIRSYEITSRDTVIEFLITFNKSVVNNFLHDDKALLILISFLSNAETSRDMREGKRWRTANNWWQRWQLIFMAACNARQEDRRGSLSCHKIRRRHRPLLTKAQQQHRVLIDSSKLSCQLLRLLFSFLFFTLRRLHNDAAQRRLAASEGLYISRAASLVLFESCRSTCTIILQSLECRKLLPASIRHGRL